MRTQEDTMTETDTTDHVAAINTAVAELWDNLPEHVVAFGGAELIDTINDHADALAARLAAVEARADRWRDAFLTFWGDNTGPGDDIPDLGHLGLEASDWPNTDGDTR